MLRIGGLASGMDTDSMVQQLMKAESIKVDRVKQEKQIMEWKQQLYNELNKDLANFILKSKKDLGYNMSTGRPGNMNWGKKSISSDEKIGTATVGKDAITGSHTIKVKSLARGVSGVSSGLINGRNWKAEEGFNFNLNGEKISIEEGDTLSTIAKKISSSGAGVQASYDPVLDRFFINTTKVGEEAKIEFSEYIPKEGGNVDPETISSETGLEKFLNYIDININEYNENGELIKGSENSKKLIDSEGIKLYKGNDGKVEYNGIEVDVNSNSFTFNGVTFNISSTAKVDDEFTIDVITDMDTAIDKVKDFVNEYNKIIDKFSELLSEKVNRNFKPLTDEQREAMSDKEVELWEEKAKSGLIRNDSYIGNMLSNMRIDIYKDVEGITGSFKNITQIGITTQEYKSGTAGGKLKVNEDKLREALEKDFDGVMELLFKEDTGRTEDGKLKATSNDFDLTSKQVSEKRNNSGIITRIFDNMIVGIQDIVQKSGTGTESGLFREIRSNLLIQFTTKGGKFSGKGSVSDIDDELLKFDKKLDDLNALLFRKENAYYAKFTAMEKAMQRMSSQSSWIAQQLGGGGF